MGLDFNYSEAHWAYSGFHGFRAKLAAEIGICLDSMQGFSDVNKQIPFSPFGWSKITDPIKDLLDHSDCDGELTPDQCKVIAPRLRELISEWIDDDYDKKQAILLADGMDYCAMNRVNLEFC